MVKRAVESILASTGVPVEVIVVDDGGSDNTKQELMDFEGKGVRYIQTLNRERGAARNTGLEHVNGKYVNFFDSDDLLLPCLDKLVGFIENEKNPAVIYGDIEHVDETGNILKNSRLPYTSFTKNLLHNNFLACGSVFVRTDVARHFLFHEDRRLSSAEDWELWLRVHTEYTFIHFPFPVFRQVHHSGRSLRSIAPARIEERDGYFASLVTGNVELRKFYGPNAISLFVADRFSFIALNWVAGDKRRAFRYWRNAWRTSPAVCLRRRFWAVLKNLIFR